MNSIERQPWADGRNPANRCTARRTNGEPCKRAPIEGSNVCATHGGRAPQVKRRAQQRLDESSDIAVRRIVAIMNDDTTPVQVRLAAAKDVLDRAGLSGAHRVELSGEMTLFERSLSEVTYDEVEIVDDLGELAVIDAEVVEPAEVADEAEPAATRDEDARRRREARSAGTTSARSATEEREAELRQREAEARAEQARMGQIVADVRSGKLVHRDPLPPGERRPDPDARGTVIRHRRRQP